MTNYSDYVIDNHFLDRYNAYQAKYAERMPERDKVTLKIIAGLTDGKHKRVLDIGCSTGNLLLHIKRFFPNLELFGGDLAESSIEIARKNPDLAGVKIAKMDMLAITGEYDVIVSNAVTYLFTDEQFVRAASGIRNGLRTGGAWIDFDWFSPFTDQRVTINEITPSHPKGIDIHIRTYKQVSATLSAAGFKSIEFKRFDIPIDIALTGYEGDPITYTEQTMDGRRLQFRGALSQPWCHLVATT